MLQPFCVARLACALLCASLCILAFQCTLLKSLPGFLVRLNSWIGARIKAVFQMALPWLFCPARWGLSGGA